MAHRLCAGEFLQRRRQSRVNADQGAAIGFVVAMRIIVARARRQFLQRARRAGVTARDRQLPAEFVNFHEIKAQRGLALHPHGGGERVGGDVGIAVAVSAHPCAHTQERRHAQAVEPPFDLGV